MQRYRSLQCCTCSKWIHLRSSLLSFYRFNAVGSFHSWSCFCFVSLYCCVPVSSEDPTFTSTVTYPRVPPACIPLLFNLAHLPPLPMQCSRTTNVFKLPALPSAHSVSPCCSPSLPSHVSDCSPISPASFPDSLRVP